MKGKFDHLLQPIRNLATNWDVNVAEELEDYLEELESIHFELEQDAAAAGLNFAEAALVIQGSASVYGKKVEYLHSLVYAALEAMAEKRARGAVRDDASCGEGSECDTEEQFLTLDDIAEGGADIDLQDCSPAAAPPTAMRPPTSLYLLGNCEGPMSTSRFQMHADSSGAILLDPSDSMARTDVPNATESSHQAAEAGEYPQQQDMDWAGEGGHSPVEACEDADHQYNDQDSDDDVIEDPYRPLLYNDPGTLPEKPFKLKMPQKRAASKVDVAAPFQRLVRVVPLHALSMPEFEVYIRALQQKESSKQGRQRQSRAPEPADHEQQDAFDMDGGDGYASGGDSDGGEEVAHLFSPILGGEAPFFAEAVDEPVPYQDVAGRMMFEAGGMELSEELEERVKLWQQSIQPHLEAQDRHPVFDIKLYGERIVETMQQEVEVEEWTSFGTVAKPGEKWEITRLFASMLQLVNAGSIQIMKS